MKKLKKYFETKKPVQETEVEIVEDATEMNEEEKKPMSLKKKIAIGVGAAAALVLGVAGIAAASKRSDDDDYEEDDYFEFDPATETAPAQDSGTESTNSEA